ncbi:MAG: NB-ARC domain-containing protein [Rhodospirillales bacterium]
MPEAGGTKETLAPSPARDLIFVSYSHRDKLHLEDFLLVGKPYFAPDRLVVWSDREIRTGYKWLPAIEEALARARLSILLISPHFFASSFIQDSELPPIFSAADQGACAVIPIHVSASGYRRTRLCDYQSPHDPARPLDLISPKSRRNPIWVRIWDKIRAEAEAAWGADFDRVAPAVATYSAPVAPLMEADRFGPLHGVPDHKPHFLARDELEPLVAALLGSTTGAVGLIGAPIGLHGMGGIGKTELAIALCHDARVCRAFPDGLYWLTLGQSPDPLRLLSDLAALSGETPAFASVVQAQEALRQRFRDRAVLLVIDDLWRLSDARDLAVLGPKSRMLITTRDASLLTALAAREISLGVLGLDLSLRLLGKWSGQSPPLPEAAGAVAEECGRLPLALALAGARVHDGASWEQVVAALKEGDLEFLDHPHGSVLKALRMSVAALPPDNAARYGELAVFPEDVPVPVATVARLWAHTGGLAPRDTGRLLDDLARTSLLSRTTDQAGRPALSFHDLQRDFLKLDAADLPQFHRRLLDAHRPAAGWADLPSDEPYLWTWLAWHLAEAEQETELKALLMDPAWLKAKLANTDINALIADYNYLPADEDLHLVKQALRLSARVLARMPEQLEAQIAGRLRSSQHLPIRSMLEAIGQPSSAPTLIPVSPSLIQAGDQWLANWHVADWETREVDPQFISFHENQFAEQLSFLPGGGSLLALVGSSLKEWDIATELVVKEIGPPHHTVAKFAAFKNGRQVLFACENLQTLCVWDLANDTICRLRGPAMRVKALAVQSDGVRAVSGHADGSVKLWDIKAGRLVCELGRHEREGAASHYVDAVAILTNPDLSIAVSAGQDSTLRMWDLTTGMVLLCDDSKDVHSLAVIPQKGIIVTVSNSEIAEWDIRLHKKTIRAQGILSSSRYAASTEDGRYLLLKKAFGKLSLWDSAHSEFIWEASYPGVSNHITAGAISSDKDILRAVTATRDGYLTLWDLSCDRSTRSGAQGEISGLAVVPGSPRAISTARDGSVTFWDLATGAVLHEERPHDPFTIGVQVYESGERAVSASGGKEVIIWNIENYIKIKELYIEEKNVNFLDSFHITKDKSHIIVVDKASRVFMLDINTGAIEDCFQASDNNIRWFIPQAIPNSNWIIFKDKGGFLCAWNSCSKERVYLDWFRGSVRKIVFSPCCAIMSSLIYKDDGHYVHVRKISDNISRYFPVDGHDTEFSISPDLKRLVTAGRERLLCDSDAVTVWDLESGESIARLTIDFPITCVAAAGGNLFVAGDKGGAVHILKLVEPRSAGVA